MKKKDFVYEEDFTIHVECDDCGIVCEDEEFFDDIICPECGGMLINTTSHEGVDCSICGKMLDSWDNAYRHEEDYDVLICEDCYKELDE